MAFKLLPLNNGSKEIAFQDEERAPLPTFPDAEGCGRYAKGGKNGEVYHVKNLNDSGSGSLRYGIDTSNGPRQLCLMFQAS